MKILQLCKKFPFPLKDGESIAVTYLSQAMHQLGSEVTLLAMNTTKHYFNTDELPDHFNHYQQIHTVPVDNQLKPLDAFFNLFSKKSYHISRFEVDDFKTKLIAILKEQSFDVIQLETVYLAPYIPIIRQYTTAKIAMRAHNVEFEIWERVAQQTTNPLKKWYVKYLTRKLKRYEISQLQNYDVLVGITQRDVDYFKKLGYQGNAITIPIGLELKQYQPNWDIYQKPISLSFIGSLDWMPNLEGVQWLLKEIMPRVKKKFPNLSLHIAGRNTPDGLFKKQSKNLTIHGEVEDAKIFINNHAVMLVPLFSGSGMRAKILEAMALGRTVITTTIGVEGIPATPNQEVLLADTPEEWMQQLNFCVHQQHHIQQIGEAARNFVALHYDNTRLALQLLTFYNSI